MDNNVDPSSTMQLVNALITAGVRLLRETGGLARGVVVVVG